MNKQEKPIFFQGRLLFFLLFTWAMLFPIETKAAVTAPPFETLPIDETMVSTAGKAGTPAGEETR